jgi:thioredoxin-like negative regulator of GroEL
MHSSSIAWVAIDADECVAVAEAFAVSAVPAVVLLRAGRVLLRVRGYDVLDIGEAVGQFAGM